MSALTLALDGSTYSASIALLRDGKLIGESVASSESEGGGRGEALVPMIARMLEASGLRADQITEVICGAGPGSFTSLRVAASVGKGIAVAAQAKMYSVSSLLLTVGAQNPLAEGNFLSVLPAMRGELFALPVTVTNGVPAASAPRHTILGDEAIAPAAALNGARVIGPGQQLDVSPHARGVAALYGAVVAGGAIDLDRWEPDYGRLAEAQVKWEAAHGRPLTA